MCRGLWQKVEYMLSLTTAPGNAVTGLLQSYDKLAPPGELFCLLLMHVECCSKQTSYSGRIAYMILMFYIKRPKLHVVTQFSTHNVINKNIVTTQLLNKIYQINA